MTPHADRITSAMLAALPLRAISGIRGHVEGDQIAHFPVELRVGFKLEQP